MYVQVIQGRTTDAEGFERQMRSWETELRSGAKGFLGGTAGVTAGGDVLIVGRFESAEAAEANGGRPGQTAWWDGVEKDFSEPPTFHNGTETDVYRDGGSDKSTFVQVIQGRADRKKVQVLDQKAEKLLPQVRPDLLGSLRAWDGDLYTELAYFTSEADARANESKPIPAEAGFTMADFQETMGSASFYDFTKPILTGPA